MDDRVAAGKRGLERFGIGEVSDVRLARNAFQICQVAGLADEKTQLSAVSGKRPRHMMADKSRRAGKKYFHSLDSLMPS
jgi:hypothetical protein